MCGSWRFRKDTLEQWIEQQSNQRTGGQADTRIVITDYHAKYYAYELTRQCAGGDVDRLSQSLFDATVDLNPHQINAALFALNNPLNKGVILADEVGLGKTIEAGLVLCQYWAERKRNLLIICPASLRKQWAQELRDKFNLPSQILDANTWRQLKKQGVYNPFNNNCINILSYHFAARLEESLVIEPWHLVVMDEAHKLRNAYRPNNKYPYGPQHANYHQPPLRSIKSRSCRRHRHCCGTDRKR